MLCWGLCRHCMMAIAAYGSQKEDDLSTEDTLGAHGEAGRVPISQIAGISWRENGSQSWLRDIDFIASSACTGQTWMCSFSFVWTNSEHQKENVHTDVVAKIIRIRLFSRSWLISLAMMQPYRYGVMLLENRSPYVQCRSLCIANDSVLGIGLLCLWCHRIVLDILTNFWLFWNMCLSLS